MPRRQAEKRRDELATLNESLRRANYVADMNLARHAWDENNLVRASELLEKHRPGPGEADLRGFEWHYLRRLFHGALVNAKAHGGRVTAVAFAPDGKRLFSSGIVQPPSGMVYGDTRGEVKLWDVETGRELRLRPDRPGDNAESYGRGRRRGGDHHPQPERLTSGRSVLRSCDPGPGPRHGQSRHAGNARR